MDPSMEAEVTRLLARCREAWASARIEGERTRKLMDESCKLVAELMALEVYGPRPFRCQDHVPASSHNQRKAV